MGLHISWVAELDIDQLNLVLDVFNIFCLKYLIFEDEIFAGLLQNLLDEPIEVIVVKLSAKNILVDFLAKLHNLFEVLIGDIVL